MGGRRRPLVSYPFLLRYHREDTNDNANGTRDLHKKKRKDCIFFTAIAQNPTAGTSGKADATSQSVCLFCLCCVSCSSVADS